MIISERVGAGVVSGVIAMAVSLLARFLMVPVLLRLLGTAGYGLIGVYAAIVGIASLLDVGLTPAINREVARMTAHGRAPPQLRALVRTLELIYVLVGLVVAVGIWLGADAIATYWLKLDTMSRQEGRHAIRIMALAFFFQWPDSFYGGALFGMHRQVFVNAVRMTFGVAQAVGAYFVLRRLAATPAAYFSWMSVCYAGETVIFAIEVWRRLGMVPRQRPSPLALAGIAPFAGGAAVTAVLATVLTYSDRVLLSRTLSLRDFGKYTVANTMAALVGVFAGPIANAFFPSLSRIGALNDKLELQRRYRQATQLLAVVVMPVGAALIINARVFLTIATRDARLATEIAPMFQLFVVGFGLNAVDLMPFSLQMACGWTSLAVYKNVAAIAAFVPALFVLVNRWGAIGGAVIWLAINASYLLTEIPAMHARILRGEAPYWYVYSLALPVATCAGCAWVGRRLVDGAPTWAHVFVAILSATVGAAASGMLMPELRPLIVRIARRQVSFFSSPS